jgi:hypothetical protein
MAEGPLPAALLPVYASQWVRLAKEKLLFKGHTCDCAEPEFEMRNRKQTGKNVLMVIINIPFFLMITKDFPSEFTRCKVIFSTCKPFCPPYGLKY